MTELTTQIKDYRWLIMTLPIFLIGAFIQPFDDEFEVLLGGNYLLHGKALYTNYFSHHLYLPYLLAAGLEWLTHNNFPFIRLIWATVIWLISTINFVAIRTWLGLKSANLYAFILWLMVFLPHNYFFSLQSDSISAHFITLVVIHLATATERQINPWISALILSGLLIIITTSLSFLPLVLFLLVIWGYNIYRGNIKVNGLSIVLPLLVFALISFLILRNSVHDFFDQIFVFNAKYYSQFNYEMPTDIMRFISDRLNRFAKTIDDFIQHIYRPSHWLFILRITICVIVLIYMLRKNKLLFTLIIGSLFLASFRSGLYSNFDDNFGFQQLTILLLSFICVVYLPKTGTNEVYRNLKSTLLMIYIGITTYYSGIGALKYTKKFVVYGGVETAWDNSISSEVLKGIKSYTDNLWILPFSLRDQYFIRSHNAMKYQYILPWHIACEPCIEDIKNRLSINPPNMILWNENQNIWGMTASTYAKDFIIQITQNYTEEPSLSVYRVFKSKMTD